MRSARLFAATALALLAPASVPWPQDPQPPARRQDPAPARKLDDELADAVRRGDADAARRILAELQAQADLEARGGTFRSAMLDAEITHLPSVFPPHEGELYVGPFLIDHARLFAGKRCLEIGCGSGILSLAMARFGAAKVVCTDINPKAIESVRENAKKLGYADRIEARLVGKDDMSAYAVIGKDEVFDVILSNPPYSLDLDAPGNTPVIDTGDLGFSMIRGFPRHLAKDGIAVLFFNSLFYHQLVVKFATHLGFQVRSHNALGITPWEFESLFNHYARRVAERERVPREALAFHHAKDNLPFALTIELRQFEPRAHPLVDGFATGKVYRGFLTVTHKR
jgi:predicted RNA methylase